MAKDPRLIYLPLGGAGEIGMNMYLYGYGPKGRERFIIVDVGVTFPDMETSPGVDLIFPDISFLEDKLARVEGIFITHAHEDHVGALGYLFDRLRAPIYARRFTARVAQNKLRAAGHNPDMVQVIKAWPQTVTIGDFTIGFVPVAHSIPEASGLMIETPGGKIFHSGDFKTDRSPVLGEAYDPARFEALGAQGIDAFMCDSTNIFSPHPGRSEQDIAEPIADLVASAQGMLVATTFASNVARLKTLAEAGVRAGRKILILGRAMNNMLDIARDSGVLDGFPPTIALDAALDMPRDQLMVLATGSQGEHRAATAQLSQGSYRGLRLKKGDTMLFSSKTIPGNEPSVARVQNRLSEMGVHVIGDWEDRYHVSGHANRPDLEELHRLLRPQLLVPLHGEHRHLRHHAELARAAGLTSLIAANGSMVEIKGKQSKLVDEVETGRLYLDGTQIIGSHDGVVRDRLNMARRGALTIALVLEADGALAERPWAEATGLPLIGEQSDMLDLLEDRLADELRAAPAKTRRNDGGVEELVRRHTGKLCLDILGKKPVVKVMISRVE